MSRRLVINSIGSSCLIFLTALVISPVNTLSSPSIPSQQTFKLNTKTGNQKKLLHTDQWNTKMTPLQVREYLTTRTSWLKVTPDCDKGTIKDEPKEAPDAWSITSNDGSIILCTNTQQCDCNKQKAANGEPCHLSYNIRVTTPPILLAKEGAVFTFDIEYELTQSSIRRTVYDIETVCICFVCLICLKSSIAHILCTFYLLQPLDWIKESYCQAIDPCSTYWIDQGRE